jgi:H+/Cl- antiporter ClcA
MAQFGKYILFLGLILVVVGGVLWLSGNKLSWLGNLPGDIRIEKENVKIYIPITTMILVSVVLSLVFWLIRRFF